MKRWLPYVLIGIFVASVTVGSFSAGLFSGLDLFLRDNLFSTKHVSEDIVIVSIDNESLARIGQWPWPRSVFADFFKSLNVHAPRAVGFDVIFADPSRLGAGDDRLLADALRDVRYPVIFPTENIGGASILPLPVFTSYPLISLGHVNIIADPDGVVRTFPRKVESANLGGISSLAESTVAMSKISTPSVLRDGNVEYIVYTGVPGSIRRIPFWRIASGDGAKELAGKIVFVGSTASDLHDEKATPFAKGIPMPGVEIQANIANMFLMGYALHPLSFGMATAWIVILALASALGFAVFSGVVRPILLAGGLLVVSFVLIVVLFGQGIMASAIYTLFAVLMSFGLAFGYRYVTSEREKNEIKKVFSKYVSGDVLNEILKNPKKVTLGGEEKEVTLFFSDIRSFTTLSERTTPQELVRILNTYFTAMTAEVLKHGGVLDKYIGDAVMAFWGAPIEDPNQADHAIDAAKGMLVALDKLNAQFRAAGDPEIKIGIGIYTGPAVVGNVGSDLRFDYTAIGDTVNAASRLEGVTKEYKVPIVIGESTKNKAKKSHAFRSLGEVTVKGRVEPIKIYTLE